MSQFSPFNPLSSLPFPLLQLGENGETSSPNSCWCHKFGGSESTGFSLEESLTAPDLEQWNRLRASDTPFQCAVTLRGLRCVLNVATQEGGTWLVLATEIEEILEHIEADYEQNEVALRMSMQQWHSFFHESATGKAVVGPDGDMLALNPQMCQLFGYSEEQMLRQSPRDLRHPDEAGRLDGVYASLLGGGPAVQGVEARYLRADGTTIQVLLSISLIRDSKGHPLYFAVEIQDDTARREAESALEAKVRESSQLNQELGRSNAELERFAFVASHDLQEPLRKIRVFGGRLEKALEGSQLAEPSLDYLARMLAATSRMQQLISDLLEFSRPTPPQKMRSVNLTQLAQEAASDFEATLETKGGHIEIEPLPTVEGVAPRLRQLLCNLIGNGLKFRGEEPPLVHISANPAPAGEYDDDPEKVWWEIRVSDNGIGFDEKDFPRLLEVFGRLHPRDRFAGTGIGLAICRKVVQEHGGEIRAQSSPGAGATFIITLPEKR